jgi:hypothetical protein
MCEVNVVVLMKIATSQASRCTSYKLGVKNAKFGITNQHMNATCQMQSLEKDFNSGITGLLYHLLTHLVQDLHSTMYFRMF